MTGLGNLIRRNVRLFFKDKGMFFSSLITPIILLVLYITFLAKVYRDSFISAFPTGVTVGNELINGIVAGQLVSSLLAVSCVTVAFCSNLLMINDKVSGAVHDLTVSPVRRSTLALGYFISSAVSTLIISFVALAAGLLYVRTQGWYMSAGDLGYLVLDVFLLTLFGTALSSCINFALKTSGQASAVGTIVSAGYGFLCGAYMPMSQFGGGLQKTLMFLPGTYGTSLIRNHAMVGAFRKMDSIGFPPQAVEMMKNAVDCKLFFFDNEVTVPMMYAVLCGSTVLLILLYILLNKTTSGRTK